MRFLFYSHDGMGLGHVRRNLAIAAALTRRAPSASVLLVTGADEIDRLGVPPGVDVLKLPGLRKVANDRYAARRLRLDARDILAVRSALLLSAVRSYAPTVLLADKHPLGARGELRDALAQLELDGGIAVLGLRDILDEGGVVRLEWGRHDLLAAIEHHYARVLVYGSPDVFDLVAEYGFAPELASRTRFCGYVTGGSGRADPWIPPPQRRGRPVVLATVGGGEGGAWLLEAFIAAARGAPWDAVAVAGPHADVVTRDRLDRRAEAEGVRLHTFVPNLSAWFGDVDALVCMGGYNTLAEAVNAGTATVCVPRVAPRAEQAIRAQAFARLGLLQAVDPDRLDPAALRARIDSALAPGRDGLASRARAVLGLDGADRAADFLVEMAAGAHRPREVSLR